MKVTNEQAVGRDVARNFRQLASEIGVLKGEAWVAPTLGGTWVDYGFGFRTARYRKIGDLVQIEGLVKLGTSGSTIFTLPVGYRPPQNMLWATVTDPNVFGRLDVMSDGRVIVYIVGTGTSGFASINCSFCTI